MGMRGVAGGSCAVAGGGWAPPSWLLWLLGLRVSTAEERTAASKEIMSREQQPGWAEPWEPWCCAASFACCCFTFATRTSSQVNRLYSHQHNNNCGEGLESSASSYLIKFSISCESQNNSLLIKLIEQYNNFQRIICTANYRPQEISIHLTKLRFCDHSENLYI